MTAIAEQLDAKLRTLDAGAAASLARLVREAIELTEMRNDTTQPDRLPIGFFADIAREFGAEPFERPPQGSFEQRDVQVADSTPPVGG